MGDVVLCLWTFSELPESSESSHWKAATSWMATCKKRLPWCHGNALFPRFQPVYPQSTFSMRSHVVTSSLKPNISKNQLSQGNIPKNTSKSSLLETFQGMIFQKKLHFYTLSRKSHPGATGFPPLLLPETCQTAPWHNGAKGFDENWRSYEVFWSEINQTWTIQTCFHEGKGANRGA